MENSIKPKFESFDVRTSWDEGNNRWAKELAISILNEKEKKKRLPFAINKREVGEEFYIIVCSPEFFREPNDQVSQEDIKKAIILDGYSESEVETKLRSMIDSIGEVSLSEFESKMESSFNMSDWYGGDE